MSTPHYTPADLDKKPLIGPKGRGSYFIKGTGLEVVWGKDKRYWTIPADKESGSIELLQVSWLEVTGSVPSSHFEKNKTYKLSFKLKLKNDAFGWEDSPVYFMVKPGQGKHVWKKADLSKAKSGETQVFPENMTFSYRDSAGGDLLFGLYEIWRGRWKGGLTIEGVEIVPVA